MMKLKTPTKKDILKTVNFFLVTVYIPAVVNYFVYFGFVSGYTRHAFSYAEFISQYTSSIYKYRFLSRELVIIVYDFLNSNLTTIGDPYQDLVQHLDVNGSPNFYLSYYLFNTFFLILMLVVTFSLFYTITNNSRFASIITIIFCLIICLSQFVVVPYDCLAYFFLMLSIFFIIKMIRQPKILYILLISLCIILGGLTRETIVLVLSFYGAVIYAFYEMKIRIRSHVVILFFFTLVYGCVYIGLRFKFGFDEAIADNLGSLDRIFQNFTQFSRLISFGLFLSCLFVLFYLIDGEEKVTKLKTSLIFLFLSLPYILPILYTGNLFEFRLFVPVILVILVLLNLDYKNLGQK